MGLQVYRRRAAGVWEHSGASAQLRRSLVVPSGAPWVLLFLLAVVALACLRLAHFHPGALAHLHLRPPRMPRRRVGLALEPHSSALPADSWAAKAGSNGPHYSGADKTLSFAVCGGFAQQRVALLSGLVLAVELNRTVVLPQLLSSDVQTPGLDAGRAARLVSFGDVYNQEAFILAMRVLHVRVAAEPPAHTAVMRLSKEYDFMSLLRGTHASTQHLRVDCPALKMPPDFFAKHEALAFAAMDALQPAQQLQAVISMGQDHLRGLSAANSFNVLHLKAEHDWLAYCAQWERLNDGVARDNCANNTRVVGEHLRLHRVDCQLPLLLSINEADINNDLIRQAMQDLEAHSYKVVLREDVFGRGLKLPVLSREEVALVDYYLALGCQQFVGNSVSVFSALLIMERWHAGRFATYYNGGNIPLEAFMPLYQMPWVFTYNDWSAGTEYDYMVKAAVTSGIEVARMKPYCMYSGSTSAEMYQWFLSKGVTIIQHTPVWKDALAEEGARNREFNVRTRSHLYKSDGALVGTYQRIDIPILRQFDQYNYVLFTDCDVYFRQQMKLVDWGTPLPTAVGMGYEMDDNFPYNAGIMLMNMAYMRKTNNVFVDWIFAQKNGLYYEGYGAVDQGAFNQFYEREIRGKPVSKNFNAMMYHPFRKTARIVHMHGPKPNHYLEWLLTGKCAFRGMCELGFRYGLCQYAAEYIRFAPEWEVAVKLDTLCGYWRTGIWHPVR